MALPFTDNFDRADVQLNAGGWGVYTSHGAPQIVSSAVRVLVVGSASAAAWNPDVPDADMYAQCKITTLNTDNSRAVGVLLRATATGAALTAYICMARGPFGASMPLEIWKMTAGSHAALATGTATVASGDIIKGEIIGSSITLYINGVSRLTASDSTISSAGRGGVFVFTDVGAAGDAVLDNFEVGNAMAGALPPASQTLRVPARTRTAIAPARIRSKNS